MRVAVDTHALVWYLQDSPRLSDTAADALDEAVRVGGIVVLVGVIFDLVYLTEKGKLPFDDMRRVRDAITDAGQSILLAPANMMVMDWFTEPGSVKLPDPWDRLIVATAQSHDLALVTKDEAIVASSLVPTIW